jgi:hypothetical protein
MTKVDSVRLTVILSFTLLLIVGCTTDGSKPDLESRGTNGSTDNGTKIKSSVYQAFDKASDQPENFGLYSYLLLRGPTQNSYKVLVELFETTLSKDESIIKTENLNLILIPVRQESEVQKVLKNARTLPTATAKAIVHKFYDYGYSEWLYSIICQQGMKIEKQEACGEITDKGPLIVTVTKPITQKSIAGQRMLIVNLSKTHPSAIAEVLAAYKRQVTKMDFADRSEVDSWRLTLLNKLLSAADLAPQIKKAMAGEF